MKHSPARLLKRIDQALLSPDLTPEWRDALDTARSEVLNRYPKFNSNSTIPVTCPVCGTVRELRVARLYRLEGMNECATCRSRSSIPGAISARTPDSYHSPAQQAAHRESIKKATEASRLSRLSST